MLKKKNIKVWLALNPNTSVFEIENMQNNFDFIQLMTVNPWKWWQEFITEMYSKVLELRKISNKEIFIDWWVNLEIYKKFEGLVDRFIIWSYLYN
jgi:pentose-5-phosphate-3-epimerase